MTSELPAICITKRQAGESIGVSERTIERLISAGKIAFVKLDRRVLIPVSELNRFVAENATRAGGDL